MMPPAVDVIYIIKPSVRIRELILGLIPDITGDASSAECFVVLVVVSIDTPLVVLRTLMSREPSGSFELKGSACACTADIVNSFLRYS